eukprot:10499862-Lingulodinium_polyedra.AAC.1
MGRVGRAVRGRGRLFPRQIFCRDSLAQPVAGGAGGPRFLGGRQPIRRPQDAGQFLLFGCLQPLDFGMVIERKLREAV